MTMPSGPDHFQKLSQSDTERADLDRERGELLASGEAEQQELASIYVERGLTPALAAEVSLAESTVRTMLGILKEKAYVRATRRGRAFVYHPLVEQAEAQRGALRHLIRRFFDGSPSQLVLNLLRDEELDEDEVERLKRLVQEGD